MFLKESASLVFSVSCTRLHFARGYTFVRFHMSFPVVFFSLYFAVSCVRVYLLVKQIQIQKKSSEADSFKNMRVITSYTPEDGHIGRNM
jgi:hypothetical protein